ncbi:unnamed protein product [Miscanthus lutarioriparius]|uniref:SPT2 chromatin protein n=1 Tax=Miscanthus lutarioriparius TaxID=422564 RepID=A0A811QUD7_9POAL|nr:unnamed protein product [Miscanthus lutarioriparius]
MRAYEYETNGYHREVEDEYGDEYYDQDEYEEEGLGAGDEYVEEEEPTEGQKEILELRERLKEQIRRKAKAAAACTAGRSSSSQIPQARDKFGSFFGPSKPVISRRVIEERKSLKELHSTIAREPRPSGVHKDIPSSSKVQSKGNGHQHKQKIVNQEKPAARSSLTQRADREVMQSTVKSKAPTSQPARLSNGYGPKNTISTQRHAEGRVDSMRKEAFLNRERVVSRENERAHSIARNGSNQASTSKTTIQKLPSRGPIANKQPSKDLNDATLRKSSVASKHHLSEIDRPKSSQSQRMQSAGQRPQHSSHGQRPHQSTEHRPQQSLQSRRPQQMTQGQKPQQSLQSQRTQQSLQNQRPQQSSHIQKSQSSQTHRPQSLQGQRPLSSRRYDPSRYAGRDEDVSDMEADFATIEMEEKRSARIARQEDEEQLRLIEEEERREQERKRRKMARGR